MLQFMFGFTMGCIATHFVIMIENANKEDDDEGKET